MTTKIKMLKTAAGPDGVLAAGAVAHVEDETAAQLAEAGACEILEDDGHGGEVVVKPKSTGKKK